MLDFLWWNKQDSNRQYMMLAVESEWHNFRVYDTNTAAAYAGRVAEDFYKLLVVKSRYKLMITGSTSPAMRDEVVRRLRRLYCRVC